MESMMKMNRSILMLSLVLLLPMTGRAEEATKSQPTPTKEQRAKMAEMHSKMAECLKSEKPIDDCHAEMRAACTEAGPMSCGMGMGMGMGMDHRHRDGRPGKSAPKK